ncbi:MAG: hypothetical protein QGH76_07280 [Phycisphaerales bacterium]|nr:hypothetical protein [Phycisphaerales bacterium]
MLALHLIAPTLLPRPRGLAGLLRVTVRGMPEDDHRVLVLGGQEEVDRISATGLPVVGGVSGCLDRSRTLGSRVRRVVQAMERTRPIGRIYAWGWPAAVIASHLDRFGEGVAIVDAVGAGGCLPGMRIVPTTSRSASMLRRRGADERQFTAPLVGLEPASLVAARGSLRRDLGLDDEAPLFLIAGHRHGGGAWQEPAACVLTMAAAGNPIHVLVERDYVQRADLASHMASLGLLRYLHVVPSPWRLADIAGDLLAAWAPHGGGHANGGDSVDGVLDLLQLVRDGVPLMAGSGHPVSGVPTIGAAVATGDGKLAVCRWLADLLGRGGPGPSSDPAFAARVQSITSPRRFLEGLQLRCA